MRSREQIEAYRRMSPQQRWRVMAELMNFAWRRLCALPPEERERRLQVARRSHRLSNEAIVDALK